ncbi:NTP/NDP exchange transporter [Simkania negevensis]|uniref:ADP,ATP carrier protein n=1 Tax=Simkania negevensis TaxID=83561 RepID=A0ABS3ARH9_9BACT|nr:NTP/NDP exchange transporter [Simkania negevensis]
MSKEHLSFSPVRSLVWPVHRWELKKVLSMLLLIFLVCTTYTILRNLKDTVILTAKASGAEVIPFLKVWGMLPGAFLAAYIYTRLLRRFRRDQVFYIVISSFLFYFLLFAFVLYPNNESLHLDKTAVFLSDRLPAGFNAPITMVRNWTFSTFYVISELWAVQVLALLFWGFVNEITPLSEAKRYYGILNFGSNIAPLIGGFLALFTTRWLTFSFLNGGGDEWGATIAKLTCVVTLLGCSAMILFYWMHRSLPAEKDDFSAANSSKKKIKLSIRDSIRVLLRSRYLLYLAVIVLGYNISINFTDILWKAQLKRYFTDPNAMLEHMNKITIGIGCLATLGAIFFSLMIHRFGWTLIAIITPILMTITALLFFSFYFFGNGIIAAGISLGALSPLALTVYSGSMQNCLSKAGKYSLFDASKEIAFLPLASEERIKGKAAIDGLGSGIGKSGASISYQGLILVAGGVAQTAPLIMGVLFVVLTLWIFSVTVLGGLFKEKSLAEQREPLGETAVKV